MSVYKNLVAPPISDATRKSFSDRTYFQYMNRGATVTLSTLIWCTSVRHAMGEGNSDDDSIRKSLVKCSKLMNSTKSLTCDTRVRLLLFYNELRDEIASGRYPGHGTVGNMMRVKWLMSLEVYIQEKILRCDSSLSTESNITFVGDVYLPNRTFTCEVFYKNKLFLDWSNEEILNYMMAASFENNFFRDFDERGSFQRIFVEAMACSMAMDDVGASSVRAFMGCGFCTAPPKIEPKFNVRPCSVCDYITADVEAIPTGCDYYFRSLCVARYSRIDSAEMETDYSQVKRETGCFAQFILAEKKKFPLPRKVLPNSALFLKITYILPMMTIGLLLYYMGVIKQQKLSAIINIPRKLQTIGKKDL